MRDGIERSAKTGDLFMRIQWIGVEGVAHTKCPGKLPSHFPGVLSIEIEIEEVEGLICRQWKCLGRGGGHSIDELRQRRVRHSRNCALSEVIVVQTKDSVVRSKPQFVNGMAPSKVVVNEKARGSPALHPGIVEPSNRTERRIRAAALQHDRKRREGLLKVAWPE